MTTADSDGWQSGPVKERIKQVDQAEHRACCEFLRDVFGEYLGPPGGEAAWLPGGADSPESWCLLPSPVAVEVRDEWMTWQRGTIPALAQAIYQENRFDRLPT